MVYLTEVFWVIFMFRVIVTNSMYSNINIVNDCRIKVLIKRINDYVNK